MVQIGGSGQGAGKTAVGCALIQTMPDRRWMAVKISPHAHGVSEDIFEETDPDVEKDTGRYLKAGAARAFLMTASGRDAVKEMVSRVCRLAPECDAMLVESGRFDALEIARDGEAHVALLVLSGAASGWKPDVLERTLWADALILTQGASAKDLPEELRKKRAFCLSEGMWESEELTHFVRERLSRTI